MKRIIMSLLLLICVTAGYGQVITTFTPKYNATQKGGIRYVSNTIATCNGVGCATGQVEIPPNGTSSDNGFTMAYVDIDADATTFSSSSDSLELPLCSEISWAGLYWGGEITNSAANYATRSQCRIKVNNGAYQSLTADDLKDNVIGFDSYHCFKDVTDIVKAAGTRARFTVANVAVRVGGTNRFGGWTIVVAFKNDQLPMRKLCVFNGLSNVSGANPISDIAINGFRTPPSGNVTFEVGAVTYDGDRSSTGDQMQFKGGAGSFRNISDAVNPLNDIFNSTLSYNGIQKTSPAINPAYTNTLGYDADIFVPDNSAKDYINNNDSTAVLRLTTGGETFLTQVVTMAVDVFEPALNSTVTVNDINGGSVLPGDILEYTVTARNTGSDQANGAVITDTLADYLAYVPGSLQITTGPNTGNKTDAAGDDQAEYLSANRIVRVRIGTGANAASGGSVLSSPTGTDLTIFKFRATVTTNCLLLACDPVISNQAFTTSSGSVSGNVLTTASTPGTTDGNGCKIFGATTRTATVGSCTVPTANAGPDQGVCGAVATLAGNTATPGTGTWTQVSGPATATITTASSPNTTVTGLTSSGAYVFQWTIAGSACTPATNDQVQITRSAGLTTANAGPNQTICRTNGNATMAGNTATVGTGAWSQVSGPVTATITTPSSPTTTITGMTTAGTYVFQWTISSGSCTPSTDQINVVVNAAPTTSNAGPDQAICSNTVTMSANSATTGTGAWTQVSGPVTATITTPSSPTTTITGMTTTGAYVFQWTITNAPCTASSDQVQITRNGAPTTANAGPDQITCTASGSATMAGNTATVGTGAWTQVSGPLTATITTPASPATTITGMTAAGTYVFQWTISNAPCTASSDQVNLTAADNGQWLGLTNNWNTATNWCGGVPNSARDIIIPPTGTTAFDPLVPASSSVDVRSIQLNNSTLTLGADATLNLNGNINSSGGTFNAAGASVVVKRGGSGTQSISTSFTVGTLVIIGGGNKTMNANITVNDQLSLTNGYLVLNGNTLTLSGAARVSGGSAASYVKTTGTNSRMSRQVGAASGTVLFPVGNANYNPARISNSGTADNFSVAVRDEVLTNGTTGSQVSSVTERVINHTWDITEGIAGGSDATVALQWNAGEENNASFNYNKVYVNHYYSGAWNHDDIVSPNSAPPAIGYPGAGPYQATDVHVTTFSPFSVASGPPTSLPVKLVHIEAVNDGKRNKINWETSLEADLDHYTVERSADGKYFTPLERIAAAGKSSSYTYWDAAPAPGINYYRLKIYGLDGDISFSKIVRATAGESDFVLQAYPNPIDKWLNVKVAGGKDNPGTIVITGYVGNVIYRGSITGDELNIDLSSLASGIYQLQYHNDREVKVMKIYKR